MGAPHCCMITWKPLEGNCLLMRRHDFSALPEADVRRHVQGISVNNETRIGLSRRNADRIVHAHGSLGKYPEVPYGVGSRDDEAVRNDAANIRIVSDKLEDTPDFQVAQELLGQSQNIILLGFDYNERTLAALLDRTDLSSTHFFGTAVGSNDDNARRPHLDFFSNPIFWVTVSDLYGADRNVSTDR